MAIQFIVGFNERNLKLRSALHTGLSRAKKAFGRRCGQDSEGFKPVSDLVGGWRATIEFFSKHPADIEQSRHL
jgi:hypothetical protein